MVAPQRELQVQPLGVVVSGSGESSPDLMNLAFLAAASNGQPIWKIVINYKRSFLSNGRTQGHFSEKFLFFEKPIL